MCVCVCVVCVCVCVIEDIDRNVRLTFTVTDNFDAATISWNIGTTALFI